jgi:DNA-binding NarL/FixJ family response regulator
MSTSTSPHPTSDPSHRAAPAVLVVESDAWLGSRLCDVVETEPGFRLAAVAMDADEAVSIAESERCDVAVLGHHPPSESGFKACRELKLTSTPPGVVICCADLDGLLAACAAVADANALISTYHAGAELPGVLDRVARGVRYLPSVPPSVGAMLRDRLDASQYAVFCLLLAGLPAAEVASALRMTETELESRRLALIDRLEALPAVRGTGY